MFHRSVRKQANPTHESTAYPWTRYRRYCPADVAPSMLVRKHCRFSISCPTHTPTGSESEKQKNDAMVNVRVLCFLSTSVSLLSLSFVLEFVTVSSWPKPHHEKDLFVRPSVMQIASLENNSGLGGDRTELDNPNTFGQFSHIGC